MYKKIVVDSEAVDWSTKLLGDISISFPVPKHHQRYSQFIRYDLKIGSLKSFDFLNTDLILIDEGVQNQIDINIFNGSSIKFLEPNESEVKRLSFVNQLLEEFRIGNYKRIVAIGGGIIMNISAYFAEQLKIDLVFFPTTIISMSDASIGGKVRVNDIKNGKFIKHAYKSFYEPNEVVIDPIFLEHISEKWIRIGLAEIIKHAIYQSRPLAEYLISENFDPQKKEDLLRAILWTADLKRVCLEIDPEESRDGSYLILRAGHDISDRLEEASGFSLDHGEAVEKAMLENLEKDQEKLNLLKSIYTKLGI